MTAEEFWGKYLKENILDIFDITCDFFSSEFPAGFLKGYDAGREQCVPQRPVNDGSGKIWF